MDYSPPTFSYAGLNCYGINKNAAPMLKLSFVLGYCNVINQLESNRNKSQQIATNRNINELELVTHLFLLIKSSIHLNAQLICNKLQWLSHRETFFSTT